MNRTLYSLFLYLLFPLVVMYLVFRAIKSPDYRRRWSERFGFAKLKPTDVLIHSVSMGETLAAVPLIKKLMAQHPHFTFTVTTTSPTGSAEVIKALGDKVQHCYLPFDFAYAVKRFLRQTQPKYFIIMETELWPNLLHFAKQQGATMVLANARLSQKSADKYAKKRRLSTPMLKRLALILVQTQAEAERFIALGVDPQKLKVCGSLKFDLTIDPNKKQQAIQIRSQWQRSDTPIWVAGSVHPGEFDIILAAHKQLLTVFPQALLIMAPRHPEQFNLAAITVTQAGLKLARRSMNDEVNFNTQVLLGDTMGELLMLYGAADLAFVGGTLIEGGGHNPLEPAAMGLPVFVGPNHWNFAEITDLLASEGGLQCVSGAEELASLLVAKWHNPKEYQQASAAALAVVSQNRGALTKQFSFIDSLMV
ncbi:lipid IV(A) 3-deoxy-D-manno-octulosonic acid transferase [Shewanella metallivivens]|uniref:3-deoxy-D-manno-octulosonic acid transferase n=1 Tax=Shewanella metallivivens TaxID=2872342 RepID=A0ABT5TQ31_9GAMM|nr:lipid IV(A) 3-deoxy-D-manno-octulosonic acid transferase [Shewanella metallivivens]MDD8060725.1 lipid IV(A) 3-deoxy-D-manno-octulosonic acid transferase [Shewanella metallivivens]